MRVLVPVLTIDGSTYAVDTTYAVQANSSSEAYGGTVRLVNHSSSDATVQVWCGDNYTDDEWRLFPDGFVMYANSSLDIPGVSLGPSQSLWIESDTTEVRISADFALEDDYTQHASGGLYVDGSTYAVSTTHTFFTSAAGDSYRGHIIVQNHGSVDAGPAIGRHGILISSVETIPPGGTLDIADVLIGHATLSKTLTIWSATADVSATFRGWQIEG